jgi:flavin reductase (DIM6/NTAB) family NADH-FMN oxidoreductase RutF
MTHNKFYYYEPSKGHGLPHDPFKAIVGPRPIGWISSISADKIFNLAPYSYFNAFSEVPPILAFSSFGYKDTIKNINDTGDFVYNLCTRELTEAMNISSTEVAPETDEFLLSNVTAVASKIVQSPRVLESPVSLECKAVEVFQMKNSNQNPINRWCVFGEVVGVHIRHDHLHNGIYEVSKSRHVLRGGGREEYFEISDLQRFWVTRPDRLEKP